MNSSLLSLAIRSERDVVLARQRSRQVAALLGFDGQDQTRISTAVSEIARNAFSYAAGGHVEVSLEGRTAPQLLVIRVSDEGPGIADLRAILEGRYQSATGLGLGLLGSRRLMDQCDIRTDPERGTTIVMKKLLPRRARAVDEAGLARVSAELARPSPLDPLHEVQRQNQELMLALEELERRQQELVLVNRELEDTNRGVVALYAELDEKADHLRRADELKTRFLSNMSHEFRTPVNSIQALSGILLQRIDGDLTAEQERQVSFIARSADSLAELVSDLLDLAMVEAGKIGVRPIEFEVEHLFGALRGMLRPLLLNESVSLVFDLTEGVPTLYTDEGKISQILRNFVSNALKFTERGEIRVSAHWLRERNEIRFTVADTGIGIDPQDHERIFQEFTQIDSPLQRKVQGTGLGLPLCRKLAEILGGRVDVESAPGLGSTFFATVPALYQDRAPLKPEWKVDSRLTPILVIEDSPEMVLLYEKMLEGSEYQMLLARTVREARDALAEFRPRAIVLDILLRGEDAWKLLTELKSDEATRRVPLAVVSTVEDEAKMRALGADAVCLKPIDRATLLETLARLATPDAVRRLLIVDDEEVSRYVLRQYLWRPNVITAEAASGRAALERMTRDTPDVIFLDLGLPDMTGQELLALIRCDPKLRNVPVVIVSAAILDEAECRSLHALADSVLAKADLTREGALAALDAALAKADGGPGR